MCGRYAFEPGTKFFDRFEIDNRPDLQLAKSYTATPGRILPVVTRHSPNQVQLMTWGFVPFWSKDQKGRQLLFNARAESVTTKSTFSQAFKSQRCLVPANGFYEWKQEGSKKIPYYFEIKDRPLFAFAGLYDNNSYTIITTEPNDIVKPIHHRMPVILIEEHESIWLNPTTPSSILISLLRPSGESLIYKC
jgi:putative SOS response-associated peptidase YedK